MMVGKQQVQEFYTDDFPEIYFKVERKNETSGYCYLHRFPFLKEEKYYLMFVFGNNLIHFQEVTVFLFRSYSSKARTPLWENSLTDSRLPVKWGSSHSSKATAGTDSRLTLNWLSVSLSQGRHRDPSRSRSIKKTWNFKKCPKTASRRHWASKSRTPRTTSCQTQKTTRDSKKNPQTKERWECKGKTTAAVAVITDYVSLVHLLFYCLINPH